MKYSKSNSEYFRNKKGGGLETNGKLNNSNFSAHEVELNEIGSSNNKIKIKPIKIMVKKKSKLKGFFGKLFDDEHYIFFGFDPKKGIYKYVMCVNKKFSDSNSRSGAPITCMKRNDDGKIDTLTHKQFLDIDIKELSILFYHLLLIYKKNEIKLVRTFYDYFMEFVKDKIIEKNKDDVNNKNLNYIFNIIKQILNYNNNNNNNPELPSRRTK